MVAVDAAQCPKIKQQKAAAKVFYAKPLATGAEPAVANQLRRLITRQLDRPLRADNAGVEAGEVQAAVKTRVLNFEAAVHDHV